jgi:O-antigen ligase
MGHAARLGRREPTQLAIAAVIGIVAAGGAAMLMQLSPVWMALFSAGLLVLCGSLLARDSKLYWLCIFIAAVPLNITKLFFWYPEDVAVMKQELGIYVNENLVPQMYLSDLPLAMLFVIWAAEVLARRRRIAVPRAFAMFAGFLVWAGLTVVFSRAPLLGATWLVYEVKLALMFLWFVNAGLDVRRMRIVAVVLILSVALQSLVVFYTYGRQTGEDVFGSLFGVSQTAQEVRTGPARGSGAGYVYEEGTLRRGTGTVGTANLQAKYFTLLLPLALVGALCARRPSMRAGAGLVLAAGMVALYLTYSRGGFLCTLIALAAVLFLLARRGLIGRKALVVGSAGAAATAALASPLLLSFLGSRPNYLLARFDQIVYGIELWWRDPVAGVGLNNFNLHVSRLAYDGSFAGTPIHNHYLRIAIETGAIGFTLYFGFFLWALVQAYRLTSAQDRVVAAYAAAVCAALLGIFVHFVQDLFYDPIVRTQIWVTVALTAVLAQLACSQQAPQARPAALRLAGGAA